MTIPTTIAPWLTVRNSADAVEFYKAALGAIETYLLEVGEGQVIACLAIEGAAFWVSEESAESLSPQSTGGGYTRIILTVNDPDSLFEQVLKTGATEVFAVSEEHGWRVGKLVDPFGHHWEIGRPI
jgi:PhnB protein